VDAAVIEDDGGATPHSVVSWAYLHRNPFRHTQP
jgi:hypothetical protein